MRKYFKLKLIAGLVVLVLCVRYLFVGEANQGRQRNTARDAVGRFFDTSGGYDEPVEAQLKLDYSEYQLFTDNLVNKNYLEYKLKSKEPASSLSKVKRGSLRKNDVNRKFYVILEYTNVFYTHKYCNLKLKDRDLSSHSLYRRLYEDSHRQRQTEHGSYELLDDCLYTNCFFTCDHSLAKHANVILFHETDLKEDLFRRYGVDEKRIRANLEQIAPVKERTGSKIWLLWNDEANSVDTVLDMFKFNWTMSYKSNSEVSYGAYGVYKYKLNPEMSVNKQKFYAGLKRQFDKRSNRVIWFNSNCKSKLRIDYAQNLSLHYPIQMFGKCNEALRQTDMSNGRIYLNDSLCARDAACEHEALEGNKYFLAFESKNCSDYITEKFWRSLSFGIIPIVLQPAKMYYERLVPPHSYIHLQDFDYDARKLATHLKRVDTDLNAYGKYFEWKLKYDIVHDMKLEKLRMCELCSRLNKETSEIYYESVSSYFNSECIVN